MPTRKQILYYELKCYKFVAAIEMINCHLVEESR